MRRIIVITTTCFLLIVTLLTSGWQTPVWALSSDKKQPIELEADSADLDKRKGISIYYGNVILTQGSMRLQADKLILYQDKNNRLSKMKAFGKPAHFKQRPDGQAQDIQAKANKMVYDVKKHLVTLYGDAVLYQNNNAFQSQLIVYDTQKDIVKAGSVQNPSTSDSLPAKARVRIIIQPDKI